MSSMMFVYPKPGYVVRNPNRHMAELPPGGAEVPNNSFWQRRITQGDVTTEAPSNGASQ